MAGGWVGGWAPDVPRLAEGGDGRLLADSYGRIATDLRVSLTDRCYLRCSYCMPPEGLDWLPTPTLLTDDEVVRLARIGVEPLGITEIRYTGGALQLDHHERDRAGPDRFRVGPLLSGG